MPTLSRADTSVVGRWWWSVDRVMLIALAMLVGVGYILALAATPATNLSLADPRTMVMIKQILYLAAGGVIMLGVSLLTLRQVKLTALAVGIVFLLLTAFTLVHGVTIDGGQRWISLPGFTIQPGEFLKPALIIATAWLLAERRRTPGFPGMIIALGLNGLVMLILRLQPDIGSMGLVGMAFFVQLFLDGLDMVWVMIGLASFVAAFFAAFELIAHVHMRVMLYLHPTTKNAYQAITALSAFANGGIWGRGPGEGQVKHFLPDARADFVFAVAGEEFGMIVCLGIILLFVAIVLRGLTRVLRETDLFVALAAGGLVASFGLQAFINMASSLSLIPTKGMTLPFISYGGSAVLAISLHMGFLLALTRKRHHGEYR
ncbi:MAG TPA: FtsW/RodA/SpoVE family cell cycle protein [Acetobacteraceae bacterium]|nr:FtsW/RodA/SpoVE family cell cycle protein [Acetobacteraceae bacterium]